MGRTVSPIGRSVTMMQLLKASSSVGKFLNGQGKSRTFYLLDRISIISFLLPFKLPWDKNSVH